jgi:flagellar basal-body rod protein FlgF
VVGILETASIMLSHAQGRVETAAHNVANMSTPGYKRQVSFSEALSSIPDQYGQNIRQSSFVDASQGKQVNSGNPSDIYISGPGYFVVSDGEKTFFTRQGQFERSADGRLRTGAGQVLQALDGGDLVLKPGAFEVAADGTVTQAAVPVGRISIMDFPASARLAEAGGAMSAEGAEPAPVEAQLRQGAFESSNVSTGEEMVTMMDALRRAEGAQRLVNVYDELMGRALTAFGQS